MIVRTNSSSKPGGLLSPAIFFVTFCLYIVYIIYFNYIENHISIDYKQAQFCLSWAGIAALLYILYSWYKLTGTFFNLYTIFMLFLFLFNFGQCFLWAFGIHIQYEIGSTTLYTFDKPSSADIVRTQLIILLSALTFHCGAVCYHHYKKRKLIRTMQKPQYTSEDNDRAYKAIYNICVIASLIVIPVTFYYTLKDYMIAKEYGYNAMYYGYNVASNNVLVVQITKMFFPCLVGLLIGSRYKKNVKLAVYAIFFVYLAINLLAGDRGNWLYPLIILVWMSHTYNKPIRAKTAIKYGLLGYLGLYIVLAVVSVRNAGISVSNVANALSFQNSPVIQTCFEMGKTMQPTMVLTKYGWDVWPYANTYLLSLIGIFSGKVITLLGIPYMPISDWFSQGYLGISYGAGFSIIAEAVLNVGPIMTPLVIMIMGYIIVSVIYNDPGGEYKTDPIKAWFAISTLSFAILWARNELQWILKGWFYGVAVLYFFILAARRKKPVNQRAGLHAMDKQQNTIGGNGASLR